MSKKINPSLIKDDLVFYVDLENDKSREAFGSPISMPILYDGEQLTYLGDDLNITLRYNVFASVTGFKDLINGINLFSNVPTLCSDTRNLFFKFKKQSLVYDNNQEIKNIFNTNNFSILAWVRNTESEDSTKVDSILGQLSDPNTESVLVLVGGANKQIDNIDGIFQLSTATIPPNKSRYENQNGVEIFWSNSDQNWNIGLGQNPNTSFYKSRENVTYPWQVINWTPMLSSVELNTNLPTLSVLNGIFRYDGFFSTRRSYKTGENYNDTITRANRPTWEINFRNPRPEINTPPLYLSPGSPQEPWENTVWLTNVSCLSVSSEFDHQLIDNYITINNASFRTNSAGLKQSYRSEGFFRQNFAVQEVFFNWKNITHITQPRTLNLAGTAPTVLSLNKNYTQSSLTSRVFQSGSERIHIVSGSPYWRIDWSFTTQGSTRGTYIADQIVDWPWQVTSWTPLITSFSLNVITPGYTFLNGTYITFKDDPEAIIRELPFKYYQTGIGLIMVYDEIFGISTFTVEMEYPPLKAAFFRATTFIADNVPVYRFYPVPGDTSRFYSIFRSLGTWRINTTLTEPFNTSIDFEIARSIDVNQPSPWDVTTWSSSTTALSTSQGGIVLGPPGVYDVDTQVYFNRVGANIPESEKPHIDAFVRGCKKLGLWQYLTCWPLINSQNSGTLTVYSLGGAGTVDGAIQNGPNGTGPIDNNPQWTSNGLTTTLPNGRVKTLKKRTNYNQRSFYAVARANEAYYFSRGQLIHTGYSEAPNMIYFLENAGMGLNVNVGAQGGASIGYATSTTNANLSAISINPLPPYVLDTWSTFATVFSARNLSYFVDGIRRGTYASPNPASGGTWADSITDGETLTLISSDDYRLTVPQSNGGVGLIGTMAFGADFDILLTDDQIRAFDSLYKFTLGRNLPTGTSNLGWNDTFLLANNDTIYEDQNYAKPYYRPDRIDKPSTPPIGIAFFGDSDPTVTNYGITTAWYYLYNFNLAFSASNPEAPNPWDVKEWVPYPEWSAFTAPTATPIKINPQNIIVSQNPGLSGWLIKNPTTNVVFVTADEIYEKTIQPWTITQWVDIENRQQVLTNNQQIFGTPQITEFRQISAWYWQYGSSFANAYSAESIEEFPWDVDYELWQPAANPLYNNILPPKITRTIAPEISVFPVYDDSYLGKNINITQISEGSLLKRHDGYLGFQLTNQTPKFATKLTQLQSNDPDWCLISLIKDNNNVYLYKDLNYQTFNNISGSFGLSAFSLGTSNIDVGQVLFYNRPLSSTEILQTYKWFKGRYKKNYQPSGILSEPLDFDAVLYCQKTGATDLQDISDFVYGLKFLKVWDKTVCWLFRQSQNTGTNTLYSLGGMGDYTGQLINSPVWGPNGIDINNSTSQSVDITPSPLVDFVNGHSMIGVFSPTGPSPSSSINTTQLNILQGDTRVVYYGQNGTGGFTGALAQYFINLGRRVSSFTPHITHKDLFCYYTHNAKIPSVTLASTGGTVPNGQFVIGPATYNLSQPMRFRNDFGGRNTLSMWMVFASGFDITPMEKEVRSLYKTTVGKGLGLP